MSGTFANPEPDTYVTFRDLVTVAFNMAMVKELDLSGSNVVNSFNSSWFSTFCAVEHKIPPATSTGTVRAYVSFVEDTERGVVVFLVENAVLNVMYGKLLR